jgi:hypothetical protein
VHLIEPLVVSPPNSTPNSTPNSSGHSTPFTQPESAVWSPYTPAAPVSPRGVLPSTLRIANGHGGPTFRASRPPTPLGSPFLPPAIYATEEDDESMYPPQYALRRDGRPQEADSWSSGHERISSDPQIPRFTSAPSWTPIVKRGWSWSRTFVFRGRRRRITLRVPEFAHNAFSEARTSLMGRVDKQMSARHHSVLQMTVMDGFNILWPALILWVLLTWWMF